MRRLGVLATLLVAGLLSWPPSTPAVAEPPAATDSSAPVTGHRPPSADPTGTPVTGGVSANQATELATGAYVSTFPANGREAYFKIVRQWKGSRIWYAGNVFTTVGAYPLVGFDAIAGDTGEPCTDSLTMNRPGELPISGVAEGDDVAKDCARAEEIVLRVSSDTVPDDTPFQMVIWEEPPPSNLDALVKGPGKVVWSDDVPVGDPEPVTGGADWASARPLTDGVYSTTVGNGEVGLFRVPLDYGEHLQLQGRVTRGRDEYVPTEGVMFFNPFGAAVDTYTEFVGGPDGYLMSSATPDAVQGWVSPVVSWLPGGNERIYASAAATPGDYYFAFDLTSEDLPAEVDVEFTVQVVRDEDVVEPTYDVEAPPPPSLSPATETEAGPDDERERSATQSGEMSVTPWSTVAAMASFAGAGVFAVLGVVLLARARRIRARRIRAGRIRAGGRAAGTRG